MTSVLIAGNGHPTAGGTTAPDFPWFTFALLAAAFGSACCYFLGSTELRRRAVVWPKVRDAFFIVGLALLVSTEFVPFPFPPFSSHVVQHLIVAMLVPLLLVLGRPVTLALRVLHPGQLRRFLLAIPQSPVVSALMFPPVAAVIGSGSLWVLYRTPLFSVTSDNAAVHLLIHVHMLIAGILLAAAICQLDPVRHRYGIVLRGGSLVAAAAGHAVLAKMLVRSPPPGASIAPADLEQAARFMYYGGDFVEVAIAMVAAVGWYRAAGREDARRCRRQGGQLRISTLPTASMEQEMPAQRHRSR